MLIWFKCEEENLMVGVETNIRPNVGDTVVMHDNKYYVKEITWRLEDRQSNIVVEIKRVCEGTNKSIRLM